MMAMVFVTETRCRRGLVVSTSVLGGLSRSVVIYGWPLCG